MNDPKHDAAWHGDDESIARYGRSICTCDDERDGEPCPLHATGPMTAQTKPTAADVEAALGFVFGDRFDGWLAEHDAQVAAQALRDAADEWGDRIDNARGWLLDTADIHQARADRIAGT